MKKHLLTPAALAVLSAAAVFTTLPLGSGKGQPVAKEGEARLTGPEQDALQMIMEGQQTFRFDTFGDEEFWGGALKLHHAVAGKKLGGTKTVSGSTATAKLDLKPGTYTFYCSVDAHRQAGMQGQLKVS